MARASSKSSTSTGNQRKLKAASDAAEAQTATAPGNVETPMHDSATQPVAEDATIIAASDGGDAQETADIADAALTGEPVAAPPPPSPPPAPQQRAGIVPLVLGGLVAAGIGYGAAYLGVLPTGQSGGASDPALATAVAEQGATLSALQDQIAALGTSVTQSAPQAGAEIDLSPVIDQIAALSGQIGIATDGIATLAARVGALETRPVFTGNADEDLLAAQQAADARAAELAAERDAIAAEAAALQDAARAATAQAAEAEATALQAITEAE
ncbi:MAG: hypothetical protein HQL35_00940, partial [Alphaproteobacteria bacterium]|nr:hypothetical protein [Alphaproteobacteria bacterium]